MKKDRNDLMVPLKRDLHRRSKLVAVQQGISLRQFIEAAVLGQLALVNRRIKKPF
jgi:predicted HicB family RNase H-like nuclease